jgi:NAD(P)-dependent dehydrogenase (short-subunit alcohol dehydrogenase family)
LIPPEERLQGLSKGGIRPRIGIAYSSLTRIASGLPRLIISETPAGRIGEPEDITGAAVFLASGASDFVTGKYIQVEGERHAGDMAWPPKNKG